MIESSRGILKSIDRLKDFKNTKAVKHDAEYLQQEARGKARQDLIKKKRTQQVEYEIVEKSLNDPQREKIYKVKEDRYLQEYLNELTNKAKTKQTKKIGYVKRRSIKIGANKEKEHNKEAIKQLVIEAIQQKEYEIEKYRKIEALQQQITETNEEIERAKIKADNEKKQKQMIKETLIEKTNALKLAQNEKRIEEDKLTHEHNKQTELNYQLSNLQEDVKEDSKQRENDILSIRLKIENAEETYKNTYEQLQKEKEMFDQLSANQKIEIENTAKTNDALKNSLEQKEIELAEIRSKLYYAKERERVIKEIEANLKEIDNKEQTISKLNVQREELKYRNDNIRTDTQEKKLQLTETLQNLQRESETYRTNMQYYSEFDQTNQQMYDTTSLIYTELDKKGKELEYINNDMTNMNKSITQMIATNAKNAKEIEEIIGGVKQMSLEMKEQGQYLKNKIYTIDKIITENSQKSVIMSKKYTLLQYELSLIKTRKDIEHLKQSFSKFTIEVMKNMRSIYAKVDTIKKLNTKRKNERKLLEEIRQQQADLAKSIEEINIKEKFVAKRLVKFDSKQSKKALKEDEITQMQYYEYTTLAEIAKSNINIHRVNVYGKVIDVPSESKKKVINGFTKFITHFKIIDQTIGQTVPINKQEYIPVSLFSKQPFTCKKGAIIRLHRCDVKQHEGRNWINCDEGIKGSWVLFQGDIITHDKETYTWEANDQGSLYKVKLYS